jgi:pSer/pThr/pTyr-binding forkhead associated (FHA) protein
MYIPASITIAFITETNNRKLWSAKEGTIVTIGSSPSSKICQKHKGVCENHCNIRHSTTFQNWIVEPAIPSSETYLNSEIVLRAKILKNGDRVQLGINGPILSIGIQNQSITQESKKLLSSGSTLAHPKGVTSQTFQEKGYTNNQYQEPLRTSKPYSIAGNSKISYYSLLIWAGLAIITIFVASSVFESSNNLRSNITLEKFNQINFGMTYAEVVNLIGKEGSVNVSSETAEIENFMPSTNMQVVTWENKDGSNITAMFTNGKLDSKVQIGLN